MTQTPVIPVLPPAPDAPPAPRACLFELAGARFAVDVRSAREVVLFDEITAVPRAPRHLVGVANLRGTVMPIVDVRELLGLAESRSGRTLRTLVVRDGAVQAALVVDTVVGLEPFGDVVAADSPSAAGMVGTPPVDGRLDPVGGRDPAAARCPEDPGRASPRDPDDRAGGIRVNRRGFLGGVLSTGLASALLPGAAARAQAGEIRIGMSAAFRGAAAGLGSELHRGAQAYYGEINARGGLFGRQITVVALDDGYNPDPCIRNTIQLLDREKVFLLSNYVGTPTLTRALPVIKQYADQAVVLVGNFTGAQPQREAPYVDQVFNVRASYRQEMTALVERFWQAGARRFGVYYQIDAYGRSGTDGVARALAARNTKIVAEATYVRNAKFEEDMTIAVRALREGGSEVVLCTGAYQGCAAFVRSARDAGWTAPISNVSFVGSDAMLGLLVKHGRAKGRDYTRALINSQVVPSYDDTVLPGVVEYRALMDKHNPQVPETLRDAAYAPQKYSFISLEGYVNARVIVEALRRAGPSAGRSSFRQALESLRGLDLGIGAPLTFTAERHQGLDSVYFTRVEGDRWVPVADWSAAVKA